jgi:hypothetical protein
MWSVDSYGRPVMATECIFLLSQRTHNINKPTEYPSVLLQLFAMSGDVVATFSVDEHVNYQLLSE